MFSVNGLKYHIVMCLTHLILSHRPGKVLLSALKYLQWTIDIFMQGQKYL